MLKRVHWQDAQHTTGDESKLIQSSRMSVSPLIPQDDAQQRTSGRSTDSVGGASGRRGLHLATFHAGEMADGSKRLDPVANDLERREHGHGEQRSGHAPHPVPEKKRDDYDDRIECKFPSIFAWLTPKRFRSPAAASTWRCPRSA